MWMEGSWMLDVVHVAVATNYAAVRRVRVDRLFIGRSSGI